MYSCYTSSSLYYRGSICILVSFPSVQLRSPADFLSLLCLQETFRFSLISIQLLRLEGREDARVVSQLTWTLVTTKCINLQLGLHILIPSLPFWELGEKWTTSSENACRIYHSFTARQRISLGSEVRVEYGPMGWCFFGDCQVAVQTRSRKSGSCDTIIAAPWPSPSPHVLGHGGPGNNVIVIHSVHSDVTILQNRQIPLEYYVNMCRVMCKIYCVHNRI